MSIDRWVDKEVVVHIQSGILFSHKRNIFVSVLMRWMNLELIIQSEVTQKEKDKYHISSVQSLSRVWLFVTPWIKAHQASLSITISQSSNSHPSSRWYHPAILSSVVPFSSCPQSLPASESFPISQLFAWSGQSTGVSALASFLPKNTQGWSPLEWTGWISLHIYMYTNTYIQNLEKRYWRIYLQGSNGETGIENRLMDMGRGSRGWDVWKE